MKPKLTFETLIQEAEASCKQGLRNTMTTRKVRPKADKNILTLPKGTIKISNLTKFYYLPEN